MKILLKIQPYLLIGITLLIGIYMIALAIDHDKTFHYNEKFGIYIIIQLVHVLLSMSTLVIIWSSNSIDIWKKIDQTILVVCLSIIGIWIWYTLHYRFYKKQFLSKE